ncbi:hypothetical protein E2C01_001236 [Portunus trituberculatus]|uniref:Uncharacterized protein n=1 Tax=Portunus trituberculatus TaxID=210409 RepID=A0A5B7CIX2_PORTR|nr:hypothetical protein [Portunus trituberculatus]
MHLPYNDMRRNYQSTELGLVRKIYWNQDKDQQHGDQQKINGNDSASLELLVALCSSEDDVYPDTHCFW